MLRHIRLHKCTRTHVAHLDTVRVESECAQRPSCGLVVLVAYKDPVSAITDIVHVCCKCLFFANEWGITLVPSCLSLLVAKKQKLASVVPGGCSFLLVARHGKFWFWVMITFECRG